jgi:hypothetical protein
MVYRIAPLHGAQIFPADLHWPHAASNARAIATVDQASAGFPICAFAGTWPAFTYAASAAAMKGYPSGI